nr:alpha/beta fold hydrolase [Bradyrhizobium sp.]
MLFLHGIPDSWTLYMSQLAEFSRDHMVVASNLRGFPPSDQPEAVEAYAMSRSLGDVHALLRHFGRERCILVGNDWGGYIAWVFASAYPSCVERLIILNAPHPAIFLREIRNSAAQIQASQYERDYNSAVAAYPSWYNYYRADPIKVPSSIADAAHTEMPDLAARYFADAAEAPATTSLRVDVPTLVLGRDGCTIHDRAPAICRAFDCRNLYLSKTRAEHLAIVKSGAVSNEVFSAGRKRFKTLDLPR